MADFSFTNYHTVYDAISPEFNISTKGAACFSQVFRKLEGMALKKQLPIHYNIWINKDPDHVRVNRKDNFCFFTKKELYNHINLLKKLFDFKFSIKENENSYTVSIDLLGTCLMHKYLLTWIRFSYEHPYNIALLEVNKLQQLPEFRFIAKVNIFNLLSSAGFYYGGGHDFTGSSNARNIKYYFNSGLKKDLKKSETKWLSHFFYDKYVEYYREVDDFGLNTINREEIESTFEDRVKIYRNIYKKCYENLRCRRR